jgi:hypothetical protein
LKFSLFKQIFIALSLIACPLISAPLNAGVFEVGASAGSVFYEKSGAERAKNRGVCAANATECSDTEKTDFFRASLFAGYQFNSRSDQLTIALISDKEIDEAQFGYSLIFPSLQRYTPFDGFPYLKGAVGFGNTYAKSPVLTHFAYGLGAGFYVPIGESGFRARFEADYFWREWQIDRKGEEPDIKPRVWSDRELSFLIGIGYFW